MGPILGDITFDRQRFELNTLLSLPMTSIKRFPSMPVTGKLARSSVLRMFCETRWEIPLNFKSNRSQQNTTYLRSACKQRHFPRASLSHGDHGGLGQTVDVQCGTEYDGPYLQPMRAPAVLSAPGRRAAAG